MKLIVGLGNPGRQYVGTRHNIGFELVDALAARWGWASPGDFDRLGREKFNGLAIDGITGLGGEAERAMLLKPMTYMNASGRSVQAAMAFFQLSPAEALVVLDEMALPCGALRLRAAGSNGGHNGLRDIERALGGSQYPRLRIGIDPAPPPIAGRDYVLGRFTPDQRKAIVPAIERATMVIEAWMRDGIAKAMTRYNAADEPAT